MIVEAVRIVENFQMAGHDIFVFGRPWTGGDRAVLMPGGLGWTPLSEEKVNITPTVRLPEGVLDRLVSEYRGTTPAQPATERHLGDAIGVRDRLLALVEGS